mmetsp:Transcript_1094/g.2144  ORF Transcript_1094/g.2144 Transcript_1094/m.2144 type:complete len:102 (-) Transcript_1094:63-368(-)
MLPILYFWNRFVYGFCFQIFGLKNLRKDCLFYCSELSKIRQNYANEDVTVYIERKPSQTSQKTVCMFFGYVFSKKSSQVEFLDLVVFGTISNQLSHPLLGD